jgi:hypothetical protein
MSINSLSNKNAPNVVASASLQSNGATEVRKRKKWTMEMNIFIIREYFRITKLQDVVSTYRVDLFKAFQSKYPQFPVTIQNLADQRRAIMKKNYIPSAILEKIKNDVKLELSIIKRMNWSNIEKWRKLPKIGTIVLQSMLKYCAKFKKI